jgi:phosphatidylinositol alpha-1,6-mannosyltransferase
MHKIDRNDIVYIIVGDGDDRERLAQRVKSEGLTERVYLVGGVPESELVDIYNVADIFILVSDRGPGRGEGVPLAVLEAAACGVPVIVGDEDGSQEAVVDGVSGFIVSPQNLDAIRSAVLTLAEQPALRAKMGLAARRRVEDSFAYTSFREKTKQVLSKLP